MAGNVLVGGIIGAGVDVASGAMLDLTPNPANVTLEKVDETVLASPVAADAPAPDPTTAGAIPPPPPAVPAAIPAKPTPSN